MVEEERPICRIDMISKHTICKVIISPATSNRTNPCRLVMKCNLRRKKMKKQVSKIECEKVAIGDEEMCFDTVKLK